MSVGAVTLLPVRGLPEVSEGDDLAGLIADRMDLQDDDVVVVAQKIVSKAEGALIALVPGQDPDETRRRIARDEAVRVVADVPWVTIVETRHGLVCANGGLDASNAPDGHLVALPEDPDDSAEQLRRGLREHAGADVGVVVTDTFGRPWRLGQTEVAIGSSGIAVLRQESEDMAGHALSVTEPAIVDALAAAVDLVRGKRDGIPVVVVRGAMVDRSATSVAADLRRTGSTDLFARGAGRLGALIADGAGSRPAGPAAAWQAEAVRAAAEGAAGQAGRGLRPADGANRSVVRVRLAADDHATTVEVEGGVDARSGAIAGASAMAAVAAARDLGLAASWQETSGDEPIRVRVGPIAEG